MKLLQRRSETHNMQYEIRQTTHNGGTYAKPPAALQSPGGHPATSYPRRLDGNSSRTSPWNPLGIVGHSLGHSLEPKWLEPKWLRSLIQYCAILAVTFQVNYSRPIPSIFAIIALWDNCLRMSYSPEGWFTFFVVDFRLSVLFVPFSALINWSIIDVRNSSYC